MRTARNKHMEQDYVNVEPAKHAELELQKTPRKSKTSFVSVFLGLLSFFLLAGLVALAVFYGRLVSHSWDIETNLTLTEDLTAERGSMKAKLNEQSKELERLRTALRGHCPDRWTRFSENCYLLSTQSLSWEKARDFCIKEGADLVTINNAEEQTFVSGWITEDTWIGLNDRELEGTWRWAKDNSPLIQGFWAANQPDNWNGDEDCVHIEGYTKKWNDRLCSNSVKFVCEKNA